MTQINPTDCLILVVDDMSQNLKVIGSMLERVGYETTFATSGKQALERVEAAQPDLILLDLMMPEMSGLEVCEHLKANPSFCQIPIIFLTASNEQDDLLQAFRTGAADYITKPFRPEEVLIRIENHLYSQKLKQQLEKRNNQLQKEIENRCLIEEALQKAKEAAEAANRAKSIFLANMSHELRTPLNAILGFTQLMNYSDNLTLDQQKNLSIIQRSGEHLLNLINDILDLSKIEAGRATLNDHEFDLLEFVSEIEEIFQLKAKEKELYLKVVIIPPIPQAIKSDRLKLRQILINLIGNAIKFTKCGGVSVKVLFQKSQEKAFLSFKISDTGVGIPPEDINKLFQPFVQTQAGIASSEGTGLGLAISRKYVQLLGGDITVNSQLGEGTTFSFKIAVTPVDKTKINPQLPSNRVIALAPDQPHYRILVVDDKYSNRQFLVQVLGRVGFEVEEAENGQEAIEVWEKFNPHLIWMDMRMPVMNGYEATQKIKSTLKGQATAIIALTASIFDDEKSVILSSGCDDIIYKPIQELVIFEKISQHLGVRYIYEQVSTLNVDSSRANLNFSRLNLLPTSLIDQLEKATLSVDEEKLYALIAEIKPQQTELAEALQHCTDNFDYQKILQAIQAIKTESLFDNKLHLSFEWIEQMKQAACRADFDLMKKLITDIEAENPTFYRLLNGYILNFDYPNIIKAIDQIKEK